MSVLAEDAEPADPIDPQRRSVKSATAFRTISEVSEELDVPQHVLRFWETKFPQIRPLKRGGGRRYYRPEDVELLRRVGQLLYHEGYTIKGVQRLLREGQIKPSKSHPTEVTLPLGLEELDPPPPIIEEEFDLTTSKRRRAVADEAMRAVLSELLDELLEIRDLLERDHTEPV